MPHPVRERAWRACPVVRAVAYYGRGEERGCVMATVLLDSEELRSAAFDTDGS